MDRDIPKSREFCWIVCGAEYVMELAGFVGQMLTISGGEHKMSEILCSESWYYIDACEKGSLGWLK